MTKLRVSDEKKKYQSELNKTVSFRNVWIKLFKKEVLTLVESKDILKRNLAKGNIVFFLRKYASDRM